MPYWMWIGNSPTQYNNTPLTNLTTAEVNSIVGYEASGADELKPVMMNGQLRGNNFQTTFNPTYQNGTAMNYESPALGMVADTRITTAVTAQIELFDLDVNGDQVSLGTFSGVFLQMRNGDTFFRPAANSVDAWSDIDRLYSMRVVSAARITDTTALNPNVGFNADITEIEVPCFTRGTLIQTANGKIAVEDLCVGDLVVTKDHGLQSIRWIGSRRLGSAALRAAPHLRPIRIRAGALGADLPQHDLIVSPQHRILVRSKIAQKMFGAHEVLIAAKQLVLMDGIDVVEDIESLEYFHFMFDQHEVVISNGAETESLFTGPEALRSVGKTGKKEIFELFPELRDRDYRPKGARVLASGRMGRRLAMRHVQHGKLLVQ